MTTTNSLREWPRRIKLECQHGHFDAHCTPHGLGSHFNIVSCKGGCRGGWSYAEIPEEWIEMGAQALAEDEGDDEWDSGHWYKACLVLTTALTMAGPRRVALSIERVKR